MTASSPGHFGATHFHSRFGLGLALYSGYYRPYVYGYPAYGYGYGYPPASYGSYGYGSSAGYYGSGGVRLDVSPAAAAVYVDGAYVGVVDDFDGPFQQLRLTVEPHRLEIVAPGYEPVVVDVNESDHQVSRSCGRRFHSWGVPAIWGRSASV